MIVDIPEQLADELDAEDDLDGSIAFGRQFRTSQRRIAARKSSKRRRHGTRLLCNSNAIMRA